MLRLYLLASFYEKFKESPLFMLERAQFKGEHFYEHWGPHEQNFVILNE